MHTIYKLLLQIQIVDSLFMEKLRVCGYDGVKTWKKVTNYTEKEPSSTDKLQTAIDLVEMDSVTRRHNSFCHQC